MLLLCTGPSLYSLSVSLSLSLSLSLTGMCSDSSRVSLQFCPSLVDETRDWRDDEQGVRNDGVRWWYPSDRTGGQWQQPDAVRREIDVVHPSTPGDSSTVVSFALPAGRVPLPWGSRGRRAQRWGRGVAADPAHSRRVARGSTALNVPGPPGTLFGEQLEVT